MTLIAYGAALDEASGDLGPSESPPGTGGHPTPAKAEPDKAAFVWEKSYYRQAATGHIGVKLPLANPVRVFNHINKVINEAEERLVSGAAVFKPWVTRTFQNATKEGRLEMLEEERAANDTQRRIGAGCGLLRHRLFESRRLIKRLCSSIICLTTPEPIPHFGYPLTPYRDFPFQVESQRLVRRKRLSLGSMAAGFPLVLAAVTGGLSLYNGIQLKKLEDKVFSNEKITSDLVFAVRREKLALENADRDIHILKNYLNRVTSWERQVEALVHINELSFLAESVLRSLDEYTRALLDLVAYGHLSMQFFGESDSALAEGLEHLRQAGQDSGLRPAWESMREMMNAAFSFRVDRSEILLLIHVPMVMGQEYSLYRRVNSLIPLPEGRAVDIRGEAEFLAVDPAETEFIQLTTEEMYSCQKYHAGVICPERVVSGNAQAACLSALFTDDLPAILFTCKIEVLNRKMESLLPLGKDRVQLTPPAGKGVRVTVNCPHRSSMQLVTENSIATVPPHCVLATEHFSFRGGMNAHLETDVEVRGVMSFRNYSALLEQSQRKFDPLEHRAQMLNFTLRSHMQHHLTTSALMSGMLLAITCATTAGFIVMALLYQRANHREEKPLQLSEWPNNLVRPTKSPSIVALAPPASPMLPPPQAV